MYSKAAKDSRAALTTPRVECLEAIEAVPDVPASVDYTPILGWDAGARSVAIVDGDLYARFRLPAKAVGVVCGLSAAGGRPNFASTTHAVYAHGATIDIVETGKTVATAAVSAATTPLITITRRNGDVVYQVGTWVYRSAVPSSGARVLEASLYSTGDYVDEPEFAAFKADVAPPAGGGGAVTAPAWRGIGIAPGAAYGFGEASLPRLRSAGTSFQTIANFANVTAPAWKGVGSEGAYAFGAAKLPAVRALGDGGSPQTSTSFGDTITSSWGMNGVMLTGGLVSAALTMPAVQGVGADRPYAAAAVTSYPWYAAGSDGPEPGTYGNLEFLLAFDLFAVDPAFYAFFDSRLDLTDSLTLVLMVDSTMVDGVLLQDTYSLSAIIYAMLNDGLAVSSASSQHGDEALQYAVNVDTGAMSVYRGFDFTGFAKTHSAAYGWTPEGVYRIGGTLDNGVPRRGEVDFGTDGFGTHHKKFMGGVFIGLGTDGCAYLKLTADDGCEKVYRVIQRGDVSRAIPHQGISAREWRVKLEVVDAGDAVIDGIEYAAQLTTRRWTR